MAESTDNLTIARLYRLRYEVQTLRSEMHPQFRVVKHCLAGPQAVVVTSVSRPSTTPRSLRYRRARPGDTPATWTLWPSAVATLKNCSSKVNKPSSAGLANRCRASAKSSPRE